MLHVRGLSGADEVAFARSLAEAKEAAFRGWDFSFLEGRVEEQPTTWDYEAQVRRLMDHPILDLGTGGGEFFQRLAPFGGLAVATECWSPNVAIAGAALRPVGAHVVQCPSAVDNASWQGIGGQLPFAAGTFALVVNRHESYSPTEVARVLSPGGTFLTQQVGEDDDRELRELFGAPRGPTGWNLSLAVDQISAAGFAIVEAREEAPKKVFTDIGGVAWYSSVLASMGDLPGFTIDGSREFLAEIWRVIRRDGGFVVHDHRMLIEATRR